MCAHRLRISFTISAFVCLTMCYQYNAKKASLSPSTDFSAHSTWIWSSWSSWSPCSKTCGKGVSVQSRVCVPARKRYNRPPRFKQTNGSDNQRRGTCLGVYKRFVICNNKQCAKQEDMRKSQCSAFNNKSFRGVRYKWEPYLKELQECQLNCRPVGHQFYVTLSNQVEDGTPCDTIGSKVCVAGQCKTVGCDGVVGSERQLDQCGVCGGDNSTCRIVSGLYTRAVLPVGYNLIARIPSGACNVNITELKPSSNYIALRTSNGSYIINGNWAINWSGEYKAAGTIFYYKRHDSQTNQPGESVSAKGPITEGIDLLLIYQQPNPGIKYEYTLRLQERTNISSVGRTVNNPNTFFQLPFRDEPQVLSSPHSYQHPLSDSRNHPDASANSVLPLKKNSNQDSFDRNKHANFHNYATNSDHQTRWKGSNSLDVGYKGLKSKQEYGWMYAGLSECSKTCGEGVRHTVVVCMKLHTSTIVPEIHCDQSKKLEVKTMMCITRPCPATWSAGKWEPCSATCGEGTQHRKIFCKHQISPTLNIDASEELCQNQKRLQAVRKCFVKPCVGWQVGEWGSCSAECGKGLRKREVKCLTDNGTAVHPAECTGKKPHSDEMCDMGPCVNTWFFTEWTSTCSSECGKGHVSRKVICLHGSGKAAVEEACSQSERPKSQKSCNNDKCGGKWFTGPWSQCSTTCGSGNQVRDVLCVKLEDGYWRVASDSSCQSLDKPSAEQSCQAPPCTDEWYITEWTKCSKPCSTGVQTRKVTCIDDDRKISSNCPESDRPSARRACNIAECPEASLQDSGCKDKLRNCILVVQARLCTYKYYRNMCCDSCYNYE